VTTDSDVEQDTEHNEVAFDDADGEQPLATELRGIQGERVAKALTKLEEKKKTRVARQEQVHFCHFHPPPDKTDKILAVL